MSDEQRDKIRTATAHDNSYQRVRDLAAIADEVATQNGIEDLEAFATEFATHEVVGTGMAMSLSEVLKHLSGLAELKNDFDIPTHGGDEALLEELTLNERFDHDVYYALQTLYGKVIYAELANTDM